MATPIPDPRGCANTTAGLQRVVNALMALPRRSALRCISPLLLSGLTVALLVACQTTGGPPGPYQLEVLEQRTCPLPSCLDSRKVRLHGVRVRVTGGEPAGTPANYFHASALTSDGARYLAEVPGCTPALSGPPLGPGESREGYLNFPVPPHKLVETLEYAPRVGKLPDKNTRQTLQLSTAPPQRADERGPAEYTP